MSETEPYPNEPSGSGPMIVMIVAGILICAGSIGGIGYYIWNAARTVAEQAKDAHARAETAQRAIAQQMAEGSTHQFTRVARAMAEGLGDPVRLADSYSPDGKPLLSWRVHLLPRLGENELYQRFRLNEPWDGPNNRKLMTEIPSDYNPPGPRDTWGPGWTYTRGFSHEGAIFEAKARYAIREVPAGLDNSFAIVDAGEPITWTKPDELLWKPDGPRPKLGSSVPSGDSFMVATADGRVYRIKRSIADNTLRQLFDRRHDPNVIRLPLDRLPID